MYCKNCGKQIEENSKFCVECGAAVEDVINKNDANEPQTVQENNKNVNRLSRRITAVIVLVILVVLGFWIFGGNDKETQSNGEPSFIQNLTSAQLVMEDYLVAPSTAKYSYYEEDWKIVTNDGKRVKLESYVDSKNSLGETVRTEFTIIITYSDDFESFDINTVYIDGKKVK